MYAAVLAEFYPTKVNDVHYAVMGYDGAGREYCHVRMDLTRHQAYRLVNNLTAAGGKVDIQHWHVRTPYGTQAWLEDGCEQREIEDERFGW